MSGASARIVNMAALTGICLVLLGAYGMQFILWEFPCPLCLLQRMGMIGVGFGAVLNVRFGIKTAHYGLSLLSAFVGASVSTRQILLHIVPGTGSYGSPILQLHLYTWAFLIFVTTAITISILLMFERQFQESPEENRPLKGYARFIVIVLMVIAAANIVTTILECGIEPCPDDPNRYILLSSGSSN
jgi:disulfide bond formation protein DsbB